MDSKIVGFVQHCKSSGRSNLIFEQVFLDNSNKVPRISTSRLFRDKHKDRSSYEKKNYKQFVATYVIDFAASRLEIIYE